MKAGKDNNQRDNLDISSAKTLLSEVLRLVQEQTETLKNGTISSEAAAVAYRDRAWKIRELLELLGKGY